MNKRDFISWVHFGDLHTRSGEEESYLDFLDLIADANKHFDGNVDFAFLPGDNADDGTEEEYPLVRSALDRLNIPVHIIVGDHDKKSGSLESFQRCLEPKMYRSVRLRDFQLLFLNAMDGDDFKTFDLSPEQFAWLQLELAQAGQAHRKPVIFVHLYPSELATRGGWFSRLIAENAVPLVEMGHTHYNELANDGHTIYAATRSTGQIEEGPPGFSITTIDGDVVSWKFKERGPWPFVMITSPSDRALITKPESTRHVVRGEVTIRAKMWDAPAPTAAWCSIDGSARQPMRFTDGFCELAWDSRQVPNGIHEIAVSAQSNSGNAGDCISVLVSQSGEYASPPRSPVDYENAIGACPRKGIFGTQLGPNENGTKGPWPSWRR